MEILDFLQWLGVGGVALLTLYFSQKDKSKSNERGLIEKMKEQLDSGDMRYEKLVERVEKLENVNMDLREKNLEIIHEKNQAIMEKENVEQRLVEKIEELQKENELLKDKIRELEEQLNKK